MHLRFSIYMPKRIKNLQAVFCEKENSSWKPQFYEES